MRRSDSAIGPLPSIESSELSFTISEGAFIIIIFFLVKTVIDTKYFFSFFRIPRGRN